MSTTVIDNVGTDSALYFTAQFLQTGFGTSSFTVSITINGAPTLSSCSVNGECGKGYVICGYNEPITSSLNSVMGGQLSIEAKSSVAFHTPLCSNSTLPYFQVNYTISKGFPMPSPKPSPAPVIISSFSSTSAEMTLTLLLEAVFVPAATVLFMSALVVVAASIHYGRKGESNIEINYYYGHVWRKFPFADLFWIGVFQWTI
jgi:hypothetical protein